MDSKPTTCEAPTYEPSTASAFDEAGVDLTLIDELLSAGVEDRIEMLAAFASSLLELRRAVRI